MIASVGVVILTLAVFAWGTPLIPVCIGFVALLVGQSFVFGNSSSLAVGVARENAGTASAAQSLVQASAMAVSAPLSSHGGGTFAVPMIIIMIIGMRLAWLSHLAVSAAKHALH